MSERPLRVLQSVRRPSPRTNPYVVQLVEALRALDGVEVEWFGWRTALVGRYDVLHAHWPELLVRREGLPARAVAAARFGALLLRLGLDRRITVVRTLHNLASHEGGRPSERLLLRLFDRRTDQWIALNDRTPAPDPARTAVVPHGDYTDWFASVPVPPAEPGRLLYFGIVRPYKGIDRLLAAFAEPAAPGAGELSLRVVGQPLHAPLAAAVEAAARADARVTALLDYVDDERLAAEVGAAELVVLPYENMHNSGALLLALSLGRPVLVPASDVTRDLAAEVGEDWVLTYDGELTGAVLPAGLKAVRERDGLSRPDLSRRRWPEIASRTAERYRAGRRRAGARPPRPGSR